MAKTHDAGQSAFEVFVVVVEHVLKIPPHVSVRTPWRDETGHDVCVTRRNVGTEQWEKMSVGNAFPYLQLVVKALL